MKRFLARFAGGPKGRPYGWWTSLAFALCTATAAWPQASPPPLLHLQGRLADNAGQPVTSTQRDLRVEFWTLAVGGVSLGTSNAVDPVITNGVYAVAVPAPGTLFADNATVYMEIAVGSGAPGADGAFEVLSPRTQVLASAYALNADTLDGRDSSSYLQASTGFVQGGNSFGALATLGTNDPFDLAFETSGAERVHIDTAGNVGIGTTTPVERLHVAPGTSGTMIRVGNYTGLGEAFSSGATVLGDNVTLSKTLDQMQIMTTHAVYGARAIRMVPAEGIAFHGQTGAVTAGNPFSNELVRFTNGGNVGIGTTTPTERLEVVGTARATAFTGDGATRPAFSVWQSGMPSPGGGTTVTYNSTILNIGGSMNLATGLFTAPVTGVYHLTFSGFRQSGVGGATSIVFIVNGVAQSQRSYTDDTSNNYSALSIATTRRLVAGNTVGVFVESGELHGNATSEFSGFLLAAE